MRLLSLSAKHNCEQQREQQQQQWESPPDPGSWPKAARLSRAARLHLVHMVPGTQVVTSRSREAGTSAARITMPQTPIKDARIGRRTAVQPKPRQIVEILNLRCPAESPANHRLLLAEARGVTPQIHVPATTRAPGCPSTQQRPGLFGAGRVGGS